MDELAQRRARRAAYHLAGSRRHESADPEPDPGDIGVIVSDLEQIEGMIEEVNAEASVLADQELLTMIDVVSLSIHAALRTARAIQAGGVT